jgi:hypothetical protein
MGAHDAHDDAVADLDAMAMAVAIGVKADIPT